MDDRLLVVGVDEVGRGCLAGPVFAAAVILNPRRAIPGLADSKILSPRQRLMLEAHIKERAVAWSIGEASVEEIDTLNVLQASLLAMRRAVEALSPQPHRAVIDGNKCPTLSIPAEAVVNADATIASVSAASIVAKTARDRLLVRWHSTILAMDGSATPVMVRASTLRHLIAWDPHHCIGARFARCFSEPLTL